MSAKPNAVSPRPSVKSLPKESVLGRLFTKDPALLEVVAGSLWQESETDTLLRQSAALLSQLRAAMDESDRSS